MIISALGWNNHMTNASWNFNPRVELSPGLKILSCNHMFEFDGVLYCRQGWNFNPVNRAEFNPGVENAPCPSVYTLFFDNAHNCII
jgi:hypothetical protein